MLEPFAKPIDATTRICAVYGHPIKHSASPAMHNAAIASLGLNWRYIASEVHPDHLRLAIEGAKAMKFLGLNLTVPHKLLALEMCDVLDVSAKMWGAVNTIRFEGKTKTGNWKAIGEIPADEVAEVRSHGFNTDADAVTRSIAEDLNCELRNARVMVLGAGGAGRVAALKVAAEGASELFLVNRTRNKAEEVAIEIRHRYPSVMLKLDYPRAEIDLVINATSLGLKESDPLSIDAAWLEKFRPRFVYDMIYRPAETPLLKAAKAAGCKTSNGIGMLLYQGAKAFELWSGQQAPVEVMRRALEANVYGH